MLLTFLPIYAAAVGSASRGLHALGQALESFTFRMVPLQATTAHPFTRLVHICKDKEIGKFHAKNN